MNRDLGYPGKEELLVDSGGVFKMDPRLAANMPSYQLYTNLMRGGRRLLCPPPDTLDPISGRALESRSYLHRLPAETSLAMIGTQKIDTFEWRKERSSAPSLADQILSTYADLFFRQQVDRSPVIDRLPEDIALDIDLRGNDAETFLRQVYYYGLGVGAVAVVMDIPRIPEGYPSLYHELASGRRPFARIVLPQQIYQWHRDETTGLFRHVLIREGADLYRLWTDEISRLMNKQGEVIEEYEHGFGFVPILLLTAKEPPPDDELAPLGISAIEQTALKMLQILDHESLSDDLQRKTNFPLLNFESDPPSDNEVKEDQAIGPGYIIYTEKLGQWINPSPDCARTAREHVADLESSVLKGQGVHRRSQDSVEAHSGLALDWENAPIYATVQAWASRLRAFENRFWFVLGRLAGVEIPKDAVKYPEDFTSLPTDLEHKQCKDIADVYGGFASAPLPVQRYIGKKMGRAALRDIGYLDEGKKIAEEIAKFEPVADRGMMEESTAVDEEEDPDGLELERRDDREPPVDSRPGA